MKYTVSLQCVEHGPSGEYVTSEFEMEGAALPAPDADISIDDWSLTVRYSVIVVNGKDAGIEIALRPLHHDEFIRFKDRKSDD
jgi:hypothetical protein